MFKKILVRELVADGARLLEALRGNRFPMLAALWNYFPESMEWRLAIVSPIADKNPLGAYKRIQRILAGIPPTHLTLSDIALISPYSEDYANLRSILSQPGRLANGTSPDYLQNVVSEDAYVYPVGTVTRLTPHRG